MGVFLGMLPYGTAAFRSHFSKVTGRQRSGPAPPGRFNNAAGIQAPGFDRVNSDAGSIFRHKRDRYALLNIRQRVRH